MTARSPRLVRTALAVAVVLLLGGAGASVRAQDGDGLFRRACGACHTVEPEKNRLGPSLAGIVGRKAGTVAGFAYSDANQAANVVWDDATLDKYLADPKGFMPGTKMVYAGMKSPDDRKALIDYLRAAK
jgi:cytochrome c